MTHHSDSDAEKWQKLEAYLAHWPYSPYTDLEYRALATTIREIRTGKPVSDASFRGD